MQFVAPEQLSHIDFDVSDLFSMRQTWRENQVFNTISTPKPTHALLYFCGCRGEYTTPDGTIIPVEQYELVYLPQGSMYKTRFFQVTGGVQTLLVNFSLRVRGIPCTLGDEIRVIAHDELSVIPRCMEALAAEADRLPPSLSRMKSLLYTLLDNISALHSRQRIQSRHFQAIAPALSLLETGSALSVKELADACGVSVSCFRMRFREYTGLSPTEYRLEHLMGRARQLLLCGQYTVQEIAWQLGFSDPAYFSRLFRRKTGMSPSVFVRSGCPAPPTGR